MPLSSLQADFESLPEALQHKAKEMSEISNNFCGMMAETGENHAKVKTG